MPPYYPDTPVVRRDIANYYDTVTAMDGQVAALLKQLDDDGLRQRVTRQQHRVRARRGYVALSQRRRVFTDQER